MSKVIKQLQLDALKGVFGDVRDMVVLSLTKLSSQADNTFRANLAKKNVRLFMVKNSFTRKVFHEIGMSIKDESDLWKGPTALAWGCDSVGELSRVIDDELTGGKTAVKYRNRVTVKGAIVDGSELSFDLAKKMPTREGAIATVAMLALAPAARVAGQIVGPAATVAGQIKQIGEKEEQASAE